MQNPNLMIDKKDLISFRSFHPGDYNFIVSTWLIGLRHGNDWFSEIRKDAYYEYYHAVITAMLKKPNMIVSVACLKDDPEVILGYSVHHDNVLDWVHVKGAWRHIGIAKGLVPTNTKEVSHLTRAGREILKKHKGVTFNPFAV